MSQRDWFRNKTWDEAIERAFFEKLARARRKASYLRIQACYLTSNFPEVALRLLDQYFKLGDEFDWAQAYVDRGCAYETLGRAELALEAYENAISREHEFPNLKTGAYLSYPMLVVAKGLSQHYDRAMEVLATHKERPAFPIEFFRWNSLTAIISSAQGQHDVAREVARAALEAASRTHSGFRYHPSLGLVGDADSMLFKRVKKLAETS